MINKSIQKKASQQKSKKSKRSKKSQKRYSATYSIENTVISVNYEHEIPLSFIADRYRDVELNPKKFPGICIHLTPPTPKSTVLIFKNGKMIITVLKKTQNIPKVLAKIHKKLSVIDIHLSSNPKYEIVNIVVSVNLRKHINLDIASLVLEHSIYEPEIFPGLIYHVYSPKTVFLIFSSGKVIMTGVREEKQIPTLIRNLGNILKTHNLLETEGY
ncbi:MAG: TATA-box-binding protein [Candidatus Lokiarchaeota archaeon]|nr:TATA-box-binding protein [Candidatus Harpocratesius repetitus]